MHLCKITNRSSQIKTVILATGHLKDKLVITKNTFIKCIIQWYNHSWVCKNPNQLLSFPPADFSNQPIYDKVVQCLALKNDQ